MTKADIDNLPNYAGIYLIRNKINGKCYIGQAIKLKKRLKDHWNCYMGDRLSHIVLYRALRKYGHENFELKILETFRDALDWRVPRKLDELEKKYIQEYDSYNNGYNSTLGGDAGVLGLKQTDETKEFLSKHSKEVWEKKWAEQAEDSSNWVKCKNLETNEEFFFETAHNASASLGINRIVVYNCLHKRQRIAYKKWQIAYYNEEFEELPDYDSFEFADLIRDQFKTLSTKESICEYIKENPQCTYGEVAQTFELSKKTFYNYKNELGIKSPQRVDTKITKEEFAEYFKEHSKQECMGHFNIPERRYYKYIDKYINS